jgi:hypothetical protein
MQRHPRGIGRLVSLLIFGVWIAHPAVGEVGTDRAAEAGFTAIFDGKSLAGWSGDPVYWRVEDGHIVGEITPETLVKRNTFLIWEQGKPANFELKLDYRITERGNSGINYRSARMDDHPYALTGYQSDIDGQNRHTGSNYEERGRTTLAYRGQKTILPPLQAPLGPEGVNPFIEKNAWTLAIAAGSLGDKDELATHVHDGDWNEVHLIADGHRLQHFVNGVLMSEVTDYDPLNARASGYLGVQVHVGPPMKVEYRNIRLKRLAD